MPLIIIEGMDNTGKSRLAQHLAEQFRLPLAKTYRMPKSRDDIMTWHHWANACPHPMLLDRHPAISDLVYGPIVRNTPSLSSLKLALSCRVDHYLIYCRPSTESVIRTYEEREQLPGSRENLHKLMQGYEKLMEELDPNYIYDWENPRALGVLSNHLTHSLERMK